jgi:23S rRNA (guanosine2251-2'-O)-methyltransferase
MADYVYGKNSVLMVLKEAPKRVFKIYMSDSLKPDHRIAELFELVNANGIPLIKVPRQKLDRMLQEQTAQERRPEPDTQNKDNTNQDPQDYLNHQGVVASVAPRPLWDMHGLEDHCKPLIEAGQHPVVLILDGVTDAGNLGAILRVADAAGVASVVLGKHGGAGLGPGVGKTSSGADQTVNLTVVTNITQTLERLKKLGFWVVGTTLAKESVAYTKVDYKMPTVLVMGSEGKGLSRLVEEHCDFKVILPMFGKVESLNVASATAVVLYEIIRQQTTANTKK